MEDVFDAGWREHPARHEAQVDAALASLIDVRGLTLIDDPTLLRQLLLQARPGEQRSVDALLVAVTADIPKQLAEAREDATLPTLLQGLVRRLQDHAGLDATWATWAVRAWAHALALPTTALDATTGSVAAPVVPAAAAAVRAPLVDAASAGTIGGLWDRGSMPIDTPPARQPTAPDGNVKPGPVLRNEPVFAVAPPTPTFVDDEESMLEPSLSSVTPEDFAHDVTPGWAGNDRPSDDRERSIFGPLAMVVVVLVVAAIAWFALEGAPWNTATRAPTPAAEQALSPGAASAQAPAAAPVASVTPAASGAPPSDVEPARTPAAVSPAAVSPAAGSPAAVGPSAVEPAADTAAAVAPAPVEAASPAAAPRRPVIQRVDVPSLVEGAPFTVTLQVDRVRDLALIERRVVTSSGAWPRLPTQLQVAGLPRAGDRSLAIPFRAMDAPSRAVVEFVAIGRDGTRSEPKRIAIALDQPDPAVAALGVPLACTSATCGAVVESREIEPEADGRGAIYQLTVRMDDRHMVTTTAPYRLQVGSRARISGSRLVPVVGPAP